MKPASCRRIVVEARVRTSVFCCLSFLGALFFSSAIARAQAPSPKSKPPKVHQDKSQACVPRQVYGTTDSGDMIEGPVCVAVSFNAVRYVGQLVRAYTVTAGPTLSAGLTPPSAFVASKAAGNLLKSAAPANLDTLQAIQDDYENAYKEFYVTRENANADSAAILNKALNSLKDLVSASDQLYATGGASSVLQRWETRTGRISFQRLGSNNGPPPMTFMRCSVGCGCASKTILSSILPRWTRRRLR